MSRSKDPIALSPHWHVDYRLEAELPEDTIVGTRFTIHLVFSALAVAALLVVGWLGAITLSWKKQIGDWERRIKENRTEIAEIDRLQRDYATESAKIDQAYALMRPRLYVSEFLTNVGRTRPEQMSIDLIDWNDAGIVVRGGLRERSERASRILGGYVDVLRKDDKIGPLFATISLTDIDRGTGTEALRFEIKFTFKEAK